MKHHRLLWIAAHPLPRWLIWIGFAALFYQAGETFTIWLLEPEKFAGGGAWFWLALFPILLPLFFIVNRYCGCASGACRTNNRGRSIAMPPGH
jgi:hypothetical protein